MARTATERRIIERRKAQGVLVKLLEDVLERQLDVDDEQDYWFVLELMKARARKREKGVFSPSMLGSCLRQAYFAKTGQERKPATSPRSNGFFLDGNFRHYKWQFALWKAHRAGLLELLGCEIRVYHPNGDFAGTIDAIVRIDGEVFVVDFKGMHVRDFQSFEAYGTKESYRIQIVGYAEIVNKAGRFESFMGTHEGVVVTRCLLVGENKGGPTQSGSPLGLHEDIITVKSARALMKRKMHTLRSYVKNEEVPPPACTSTRTKQFQECPFAWFCREQVKDIQRAAETIKRENSQGVSVRRSSRGTLPRDRKRTPTGKGRK